MADNESENTVPERDRRRFAVSANRGKASHRIRYVETGGASVDNEECTFCQAVPDLDASTNEENDRPRAKRSDDNAAQTDDADSGH